MIVAHMVTLGAGNMSFPGLSVRSKGMPTIHFIRRTMFDLGQVNYQRLYLLIYKMGHENALHMMTVRGRNEILRKQACISFFTSSCAP